MSFFHLLADYNNGEDYDPRPGDLNFSFNFTSPKTNVGSWLSPDLMDYIALLLRGGGYRSQAINEIIDAIEILIKYANNFTNFLILILIFL